MTTYEEDGMQSETETVTIAVQDLSLPHGGTILQEREEGRRELSSVSSTLKEKRCDILNKQSQTTVGCCLIKGSKGRH